MTVLERLKELEAKATKGPWKSNRWRVAAVGPHIPDGVKVICDTANNPKTRTPENAANADLFAAVRNALPHLIAVAEAAKAGYTQASPEMLAALAELTKGAGDESN